MRKIKKYQRGEKQRNNEKNRISFNVNTLISLSIFVSKGTVIKKMKNPG